MAENNLSAEDRRLDEIYAQGLTEISRLEKERNSLLNNKGPAPRPFDFGHIKLRPMGHKEARIVQLDKNIAGMKTQMNEKADKTLAHHQPDKIQELKQKSIERVIKASEKDLSKSQDYAEHLKNTYSTQKSAVKEKEAVTMDEELSPQNAAKQDKYGFQSIYRLSVSSQEPTHEPNKEAKDIEPDKE